jgi:hypothetical protein
MSPRVFLPIVLSAGLCLGGCGSQTGTIAGEAVGAVIADGSAGSSATGKAFVNALVDSLAPSVNKILAKGAKLSATDKALLQYAVGWMKGAIDYFKPKDQAAIDVALDALSAEFGNPAADAGTLVADFSAAWAKAVAALPATA